MRPYILTVNNDARLSGVVSLFIQDDTTETIKGRRLRYRKRASKRYSTLSGEQREVDDGCNAKKKPVLKLYMIKKKPLLKLYRIDKSVESSPQTVETSSPAPVRTVSTKRELEDHLKQELVDHVKQEPEDHFKQEFEDHLKEKLEDHLKQEPEDHFKQELEDHLKQKLEDHLKRVPEDHFQQEFEDDIKQKLEDHLKQGPEDHFKQELEDHLIQKLEDHLQQAPEDHFQQFEDHLKQRLEDQQEFEDHLKQKLEDLEWAPEDRLERAPEDHLERAPEDHLQQEPKDHLEQGPESHLERAPEDHLYSRTTVYQPVTVVPPQGQPVTCAISPGPIRVQNNQLQLPLHQDLNLVNDDDGSSKNKRVIPKQATNVLRSWLFQHNQYPYPTEDEKKQITTQTNLTLLQVNNWFINARRRILQRILQPSMLDASSSKTTKIKKTPENRPLQRFCPDSIAARGVTQQQVTVPDDQSVKSSLQVKMISPAPANTVSIKQEPEDLLIQAPEDHLDTKSSLQVKMSTPAPARTVGPGRPGRGKRQRRLPRHLQDFNLVSRASKADVSHASEPPGNSTNREDFLKYSFPLSLDPNTTGKYLQLLEENRKVVATLQNQSYPDHPERFSLYEQVLSRESLPERCYFEVEWIGYLFGIAVSYKDINRKMEDLSVFGYNDKSWRLDCEGGVSGFTFTHNSVVTYGSLRCSSRVGVYVDRKAGILSFYSVSNDTMTLLHSVKATFTKPLYAGIWLFGIAEFCNT